MTSRLVINGWVPLADILSFDREGSFTIEQNDTAKSIITGDHDDLRQLEMACASEHLACDLETIDEDDETDDYWDDLEPRDED